MGRTELALSLLLSYPWLGNLPVADSVEQRFPAPRGFSRDPAVAASFASWLRGLPLKPGRPPVHLHDGSLKANQTAHAAVLDMDVGRRDLQQCADAVMRLRAEYLFSVGRLGGIAFHFTNGDLIPFARWARGERPQMSGTRVRWMTGSPPDASHASLRAYLETVFMYAALRWVVIRGPRSANDLQSLQLP